LENPRLEGRRGDPDDERAFIRVELTRLSSQVPGEVLVVAARQGRRSPGPDRCRLRNPGPLRQK
jgi:hypothetical protein